MHRTFQDARRQVHADQDAARGALPLDDPPEHELAELDARLGGGNVQDDHVESTAQRAGEATDLYAVIGVARDATDEEIKSAYRRLSMIFHPDKHRDPERKRKAEQQFTAIHAAYEVLADGNKRALYDLYGLEGLERVSEMQVGPRLKSKAELRAEYEREMLKIKQFNAEKMLSEFHTNVELTLDARHWFPKVVDDAAGERQKYDEEDVEDEDDESIDLPPAPLTIFESIAQRDSPEEHISIPVRSSPRHGNISIRRRILGLAELLPKFRGMQIVHSNEFQVGQSSEVTLSGVILTRQNRGGAGYVIASYKRQLGDKGAWMGMDIAAGSAAFLALKSGMTLNETTGLECSATWSHIPVEWRHVLPAVEMTVKRALGVQTSGWVTYRIGEGWWFPKSTSFTSETLTAVDDSIELGLQTIHHGAQTKLSLTAASINSGMSLSHSRPMTKASSMRTFVKYNVDEGIVVGAGAERTLFSKKNRLGASVECGLMHGVFLKLRLSRLSQSLSLPIQLSDGFDGKALLFAMLIPLSSAFTLHKFLFEPRLKRQIRERMDRMREMSQEQLDQKKREAEDAIELMRESYAKRVQQELDTKGLIILEAHYGLLEAEATADEQPVWIDVVIPLQSFVSQSRLQLPVDASKGSLLGFYDPCPWIAAHDRKLYVRYSYREREHTVTVSDRDALTIPMRQHVVG